MQSHYVYKAQSLFARYIRSTDQAGYGFEVRFALHRRRPQIDQKWYWEKKRKIKSST